MNKKIILIVAMFVLSSCTTKYKTSNLFQTKKYNYTISYPIKQPNEWFLFYGSTDASMLKLSDGSFLHSVAIITKQDARKKTTSDKKCVIDKAIGGSIQIFILDKDNTKHQNLLKLINNNLKILSVDFSNTKNNETYISLRDIYNQFNNNENCCGDLSITFDIGENKVILFFFYGASDSESYKAYTKKDKEQIGKEFYKIISSLTRENIK